MKRINLKVAGISLTLPFKLFRELKDVFKSLIESLGYEEMEKSFPFFFTFFLKSYEKKHRKKTNG